MKNILERNISLGKIVSFIDWTLFFFFWGFKGSKFPAVLKNVEAKKVYNDALDMLCERGGEFEVSCVLEFFDAVSTSDDTIILNGEHRLPMLRQQTAGSEFLSLVDFIDGKWNKAGLFCIKAQAVKEGEEYEDLLKDALCARLVDACSTWLEQSVAKEFGTYLQQDDSTTHVPHIGCSCIGCSSSSMELLKIQRSRHANAGMRERTEVRDRVTNAVQRRDLKSLEVPQIIRAAFGYPASPDHSLKKDVVDILQADEKIGVKITEAYSMQPSTSAIGMLMIHPKARYFDIGKIGKDQWDDYRHRRGFTKEAMQKLLPL